MLGGMCNLKILTSFINIYFLNYDINLILNTTQTLQHIHPQEECVQTHIARPTIYHCPWSPVQTLK